MSYIVTMITPAYGGEGEDRTLMLEATTDGEATRIAWEGTLAASRRGEAVTYEIHASDGRLVLAYSSAVGLPDPIRCDGADEAA